MALSAGVEKRGNGVFVADASQRLGSDPLSLRARGGKDFSELPGSIGIAPEADGMEGGVANVFVLIVQCRTNSGSRGRSIDPGQSPNRIQASLGGIRFLQHLGCGAYCGL